MSAWRRAARPIVRINKQFVCPLMLLSVMAACSPGRVSAAPGGTGASFVLGDWSAETGVPVEVVGRVWRSPGPVPASPLPTAGPLAPAPGMLPTPGSDAGGGSGTSTVVLTRGTVLGVFGGTEAPLMGASVMTTDGRQAVSGADGSFSLVGPGPADGVWTASRLGYVASTIVGLPADAPVVLHLQPTEGVATPAPGDPGDRVLEIGGMVLGPDGQPAAGVLVGIGDANGATADSVLTAADGTYRLQVSAPGLRVVDGTLLAAGTGGLHALGLQRGLNLDADHRNVPTFQLVGAPHPVHTTVSAGNTGTVPVTGLFWTVPDGPSLGLVPDNGAYWTGEVAGTRFDLRSDGVDADARAEATLVETDLALDFTAATSEVTRAFLDLPALAGGATPAPGQTLPLVPVSGANGYTATLAAASGGPQLWQEYADAPTLDLALPSELERGHYTLALSAIGGTTGTARTLAMVPPRALRVLTQGTSYRCTSKQVDVSF